jgi:hypothetical protein
MAIVPAQIIHGLPPLKFRGLTWEFTESIPVGFSHSQAERRYAYVDGAGHDWTGMDPLTPTVRMFFLEAGLMGKKGAFTKDWPKWRKALFDGTAADFTHPVLGTFRARVLSGDIQFTAQTTAGIIVDVRFTSTIDSVDKPNKFKEPNPEGVTVAKAAEQAAGVYNIPWPSQKLDTSLSDAFKSLTTAIWDVQTTFSGYANQITGDIESMIEAAEALSDPVSYPAYDNLLHIWELTRDAAAKAQKDLRPVASRVVPNDTTLTTFAAEVGNTEQEIMQLNYRLLGKPLVPTGSTVNFYSGK